MEYRVNVCESLPQAMLRLGWQVRPGQLGVDIATGMRELTALAERAGLTASGAPAITYRDEPPVGEGMIVNFCVPVELGPTLSPRSGAEVIVQSSSLVARTCHYGGYDTLDNAYRALHEWLHESGHREVGPPTEVYLIGPDEVSDPGRLITEIRIPVEPAPGIAVHTSGHFDDVVRRARDALTQKGFEMVAETDMQHLLRIRAGEHIDDYLILGACHPLLTAQALAADPHAGMLLPSTVVVRSVDTGTLVEAADPEIFAHICGGSAVHEIAEQVRRLLTAALDTLREHTVTA